MSVANRDSALELVERARVAMRGEDFAKAKRLLEKSVRLYETGEAVALLRTLAEKSEREKDQPSPLRRARNVAKETKERERKEAQRKHTPEQAAHVQRVLELVRRKPPFYFYALLEVERSADEKTIVRSYKKLSLRLHPDKNGAPRAAEAFKALNDAKDTLTDAHSRAAYDRTGQAPSEQAMPRRRTHFQHMHGEGVTPEELFAHLFGVHVSADGRRRRARPQPFRGDPRRAYASARTEGSSDKLIFQLMPVMLMLFVLLLLGSLGGPQEPLFSLERTSYYRVGHDSVAGVRYYVPQGATHSDEMWERVEAQAEQEWQYRVGKVCSEQRARKVRLQRSWFAPSDADSYPLPACDELEEFRVRKNAAARTGRAGGHWAAHTEGEGHAKPHVFRGKGVQAAA